MYGWNGVILHIDLGQRTSQRQQIPKILLEEYLGGRGLAVRLMRPFYRFDPFAPQMPLILSCGPLCGTAAPASEQLFITTRSPLTGTIFSSGMAGNLPIQLKAAGLDAITISGRSSTPLNITITPSGVEFTPADTLWGSDTPTAITALGKNSAVAVIGPAGENLIPFASIISSDGNSSGRGGAGAVMGSKNLKAITISGDNTTPVANQSLFEKAHQDIIRLFNASPVISGPLGMTEFGSTVLVDLLAQRRMTPTSNFRQTFFEQSTNYSATAIRSRYAPSAKGCYNCPIRCKKVTQTGVQLPDYEAISHFGALNNNANLDEIIQASNACSRFGLDPLTTAATIATWREIMAEQGTGSEIPLLIEAIALRRGNGQLLSLGSARLAKELGHPELAMCVKALELPPYDPRGAYGMALGYCTSPHGGCHLPAYSITHEILRKPVPTNRFSLSGKARIISIAEENNAAVDSLAVCRTAFLGASLEEYAELLTAVTGLEYTSGRLAQIGRRIILTERFYNCANGFRRKDDLLPERFFKEPGSSGDGIQIPPLDATRFEAELDKYYRIRGLNSEGCFDEMNFLEQQP